MPLPSSRFDTWIFDLDNTLYAPDLALFDQIEAKMGAYISALLKIDLMEAHRIRHSYWRSHGTTLAGLMADYDADPLPFLEAVHDIDLSHVPPDPKLRTAICNLPGKRMVYTNGSARHAQNVLEARGLTGVFDEIYGVEHASFIPKPQRTAFETVFGKANIRADRAIMFEDDARNLAVPYAMGLGTVLVQPETDTPLPPHVQHQTQDLTCFLNQLDDSRDLP